MSIGDRVALTFSSRTIPEVRIGGGAGGFFSLRICSELLLDPPAMGLLVPSVEGGIKRSSGICLAVESSTRIRKTFNASLPKLKKEKKYYRRELVIINTATFKGVNTSSIAYVSSLSITLILHVSAKSII